MRGACPSCTLGEPKFGIFDVGGFAATLTPFCPGHVFTDHDRARCRSAWLLLPSGERVQLTAASRASIASQVERMAREGLRCLALAFRDDLVATTSVVDPTQYSALENQLVFVGLVSGLTAVATLNQLLHQRDRRGAARSQQAHRTFTSLNRSLNLALPLIRPCVHCRRVCACSDSCITLLLQVGMRDPPRPEVLEAVAACTSANVRLVVITGDDLHTAAAICRQVGILPDEQSSAGRYPPQCITARSLVTAPVTAQQSLLAHSRNLVIARAEPKHKAAVVRLLQARGEVVAMTGDGVNDAPALHLADIGVASTPRLCSVSLAVSLAHRLPHCASHRLRLSHGASRGASHTVSPSTRRSQCVSRASERAVSPSRQRAIATD